MNFIIDNWQVIISLLVVALAVGIVAYKFFTQPSEQQLEQVKVWLLQAVVLAEKELGGNGTGKIKLSVVYDLFIARFPIVAKIIPFTVFSLMVDEVLNEMREMLKSNKSLENLVVKNESPVPVVVVNNN